MTFSIKIQFQLRKAIEEVNSGNPTSNQTSDDKETEKPPLHPQQEPLLTNGSNKNVQNTISSMDSALSNSDNCSDVELGLPVGNNKPHPK